MKSFCLEVAADFACFTRPEMKVERVSYDVPTPSAVRAVFDAIFWRPEIRWHVRRIEVLNPIRWINLRRNEVGAVVSFDNVREAMRSGRGNLGVYVEDERQQRSGLFLRDVRYRFHADLVVSPAAAAVHTETKYFEMFGRRAAGGQCANQPYLGCREFGCSFRLAADGEAEPKPIEESRDLGWMIHDLDYRVPERPEPRFFRPWLDRGVVAVPAVDSEEVRG